MYASGGKIPQNDLAMLIQVSPSTIGNYKTKGENLLLKRKLESMQRKLESMERKIEVLERQGYISVASDDSNLLGRR